MPNYVRSGRGKLNLDDNPYRVSELDYIDAQNITRDGTFDAEDGIISNMRGNVLKDYSLPSGVNKCIGSKEDLVRNRVYFFVWNSNNYHSILYYDGNDDTVNHLLESKTDCYLGQDILQFNPSYRINHIDIIYRDEGDLIYFTDGLSYPKCIDFTYIKSFISNTIKVTDIEMAKQPPLIPPFCWYEDDNTVTVNNLRKNLFKIKLRYVYEDLTKSTTSSQGSLPLPISENVLTDPPSKNAKISIAFTTGEKNVTKIEVLAANNINDTFSDYYLVKSIDKAELGLGDNEVGIFNFYNNEAYNNIDVTESIQDFDRIPNRAYTQASANGNTIEYANMLEGYNNFDAQDLVVSTDVNGYGYLSYESGGIFVSQQGDSTNTLTDYTITIVAFGNFNQNEGCFIATTNYPLYTFEYNNTSGSVQTANQYLTGLQSVATGLGFSTVSFVGNVLKITKTNEKLIQYGTLGSQDPTLNINTFNSSMPLYDWWTRYAFGVVFFDKKNKTNGVVYPLNHTVQTGDYDVFANPNSLGTFVPKTTNFLFGNSITTPDWAYSYQLVRTKRLNKGYFIQWISDITIKEINGGTLNQSYAYIGINSLDAFIAENPASSFLGYSFTAKDRIRFIANGIQTNGNATNIYTDKDFEILDYVANPTINGIVYTGKYIKISLPTTSGSFDFGTSSFYNYFIEVYKPVVPVSNGLDIYYEFGVSNKCTPSTLLSEILLSKNGDCYGRFRNINTTPKYKWSQNGQKDCATTNFDHDYTIALDLSNINLYTSPDYVAVSQSAINGTGNLTQYAIELKNSTIRIFNFSGSFVVSNTNPASYNYANHFTIYLLDSSFNILSDNPILYPYTPITDGSYTFDLDITTTASTKYIAIGYYTFVTTGVLCKLDSFSVSVIEKNKSIKQFCIDPNFSDYYQSGVSSNGRAFIHDVNAKQQWFPTLIRFSREYQQNTNINQTNRFYAENFDEYDRSNGTIQKLFVDGKRLYVFQQFDIGVVPVLQQIVQDTSGNPLQAQSDILLNKIQYPYQAKVGIGNVPESFSYNMNTIFGVDNNRGLIWALSLNGISEISVVYNIDAFVSKNVDAFNINLNNGYGALGQPYLGNPTIYGGFDYYTSRYWCAFEEINRYDNSGSLIFHQEPYTLTFADTKDDTRGFESFVTWYPENIKSLGTLLCSFKNGKIYTHNNPNYCTFDDVVYSAYITFVFNGTQQIKKTFRSIEQLSDTIWAAPFIQTSSMSYGTSPQLSNLAEVDFIELESAFGAAFLRDANSVGGLFGGDFLKGNYIIIKMELPTSKSADYHYINLVQIKADESKLNIK